MQLMPDELIFRILTFLSFPDICAVRCTCRELFSQASGDSLWRYLTRRDFSIAPALTRRELAFSGFGALQTSRQWADHTTIDFSSTSPAHQNYIELVNKISKAQLVRRIQAKKFEREKSLYHRRILCMKAYDNFNVHGISVLPAVLFFVQLVLLAYWLDNQLPAWSTAQILFPTFVIVALWLFGFLIQYVLLCGPTRCCQVQCPASVSDLCISLGAYFCCRRPQNEWEAVLPDNNEYSDEYSSQIRSQSCCLDLCLWTREPEVSMDDLLRSLHYTASDDGNDDSHDHVHRPTTFRHQCACLCTGHWLCRAVDDRSSGALPSLFHDRISHNALAHWFLGITIILFVITGVCLLVKFGVILPGSSSSLTYLLILIPAIPLTCCMLMTPCAIFARSGEDQLFLIPWLCCMLPSIITVGLLASKLDGSGMPFWQVFMPFFLVFGLLLGTSVIALMISFVVVRFDRCSRISGCNSQTVRCTL
jgi:hypothetical protein